jgi:hypothetical protein
LVVFWWWLGGVLVVTAGRLDMRRMICCGHHVPKIAEGEEVR